VVIQPHALDLLDEVINLIHCPQRFEHESELHAGTAFVVVDDLVLSEQRHQAKR
jgi:hypothetical protein